MTDPVRPPAATALARLRAQLVGPRGARRLDALLASPDPDAAVAALSVTELSELVHDVGLDDAVDLIHLATPEQVRGCLDLELWDRDRLQLDRARPWLVALIEAGFEKLGQVWAALDAEWRALFVQRNTVIYDLTLGEEPDDSDGRPLYFTVDRFFTVKLTGDEDTDRLLIRLLDDLYRADADLARHTLMAARSEPPAELEETSYRWRAGRLADLGYVDFHDALELFHPLEPDAVHIGEGSEDHVVDDAAGDGLGPSTHLPMSVAEQVLTRSFLARAWDRVDDPAEEERLSTALLVLVNKVLAAARVRPGDQAALRVGAGYATATVSLGLEAVARGDVDRAAAALRSVALTRLHRVGYTVALKLARLARSLVPRIATADDLAVTVVAALTGPRPWLARALDDPPAPGVRPFESQRDVRRVAEVLAHLTLRVGVAESLGVNLAAMRELPEPRPALDDHVRTGVVRVAAGGRMEPGALTDAEVRAAAAALERGKLGPSVRARVQAAIAGRLEAARIHAAPAALGDLIDGWLAEVEDTLAHLDPDDLDPRFVSGILLAAGGVRA